MTHAFPTRRSSDLVLGGQPVGCPLFNSLPDLAIVKCTDAMAHILKEVPLIAAALTEPRICDGMRPRRPSDRLGGSGQYDIHVCWRSDERRVGKECVSTFLSRWSQYS